MLNRYNCRVMPFIKVLVSILPVFSFLMLVYVVCKCLPSQHASAVSFITKNIVNRARIPFFISKFRSLFEGLNVSTEDDLHLSTSIRSFRTPDLAAFVKAILDVEKDKAKILFQKIKDKYPILLTRDLEEAKNWIKQQCKGTMRYGLIASSGALRLKPRGIFVKNEINVANWFLNDKFDVRSSYYLEDVVSEFDIQGLELDYSLVAWDGDFRFDGTQWTYNSFVGNRWQKINSDDNKLYLKNAYRVLLTRARQGMVIYVPEGDLFDETRKPEYYDKTYEYLKSVIE